MANRSTTKQRTGRGGLKLWSPSQVKQKEGCEVRWAANRWLGVTEEEGENAKKGTFRHGELEVWYGRHLFAGTNLNLFLPKTPEASAMITHMGKIMRGVCDTEVAVRFDLGDEPFVGFIDMVYDWKFGDNEGEAGCSGWPMPLGSTGITVIHDWKFTSDTKYALDGAGLSSEALKVDPAANLYAKEAFEGGAKRVLCRWVYCEFGSQTPKDVWAEMEYQDILTYCQHAEKVARDGRLKKQAWSRGLLQVLDLPKDKSYCFAFKKECPYKGDCKPESDRKPLKMKGRHQMSTSFENQVNDVTGGERKGPPALPGKKGPPALPGKKAPPALPGKSPVAAAAEHFAGDPPAENGTFNAPKPAGVKALAATPEEAVKNQDIKAPVEAGVQAEGAEKDDLDSMDVAQLKALATALGLEFTPKARAATVIGLIRSKRAHEAEESDAESGAAITDLEYIPAHAPKTVKQIQDEVADSIDDENCNAGPAPKVKQPVQEVDADGDSVESAAGYVLFVNCAPSAAHVTLSSILGRFSADLQEATGVSDYRADSALTGFGKGKGIIAEALNDEIATGRISGAVVVDSRTSEGADFVGILERHALYVVRGF